MYAPQLKLAIVFIIIISISLLFTIFYSSSPFSSGYSEFTQQETKPHGLSQSSHVDQKQQQQQQPNKVIEATGHFANNQIENGTVTWIQGGLWHLEIYNSTTSNPSNQTTSIMNNNYTGDFSSNFTMVRPNGSLSHGHIIKNFTSDNVILTENDIVVTGITDIYSNNNSILEYNQVPITVHLMGKKVLGLMIDAKKTERHFASSNELFGTLISGTGLEDTGLEDTELLLQSDKNNNNMKMDEMMTMPHS